MTVEVLHARLARDDEASPLDVMAQAACTLVLAAAEKKGAAMQALSRIAGDELAKLEGHEEASRHHARLSRIHQERGKRMLTGGRR